MTRRSIPLRRWIQGTQKDSGHQALSPAYLASSLRIAVSLAEQISDAEELAAVGLPSGLLSLPPSFPVAGIDWADCITVTVKSNEAVCDESESNSPLQPPALSPLDVVNEAPVLEEDLEYLLDLIARDAAKEATQSTHDHQKLTAVAAQGDLLTNAEAQFDSNHLHVECAQIDCNRDYILSANNNVDDDYVDTPRDKLHRIYSLGLVMYELFSGGELPPSDLLLVVNSDGTGLISVGAQVDRQEMGAKAPLDFGNSLIVSDEKESVAENCVLGSGTFSKHRQLRADRSIEGPEISSTSNKRPSIGSRQSAYTRPDYLSGSKRLDSQSLCDMSVEFLNTRGTPRPLRDLIYNMIDCINGDFIGNDTYTEISQVANDLQLMIDKPSTFLHDFDITKLSSTGLELDDIVFEHDDEFASLQCAYRRSLSGSSELAIITGMSGTGKSTLANQFGDFITFNGGLFLSGKFDQMLQINPFSGIASAFNNYCDDLAAGEESQREIVVTKLRTVLGPDLYHLIQMIPHLNRILQVISPGTPPDDDCVNAQERLVYLFGQLMEVVSSCSRGPITLFMDDVQWADSASISIIGQLLKSSRSMKEGKRFFFLGSCRDDEMEGDHSFWNMIRGLSALGFKTTIVKLDCMDKDAVNQTLSNLLHLSPRLVRSLSDIVYHKTKGNPLFVSRMLLALNREGLLRISLTRHRWEWDEEKIQLRELPEDVLLLFISSINRLPNEVNVALSTLSCFGASVDCDIISALESDLFLNLIEPLTVAIAEGLVSILGGKYYFCHDRIQEAVYSMIEEQECCILHHKYGMSLMDRSLRTRNVCLLFTAITQINLGGPGAIQNPEQYALIANYNLIAGKKAMEMSDFSSAFSFFDHGMTFLRKKHWRDHYDLSLELFNLAAKCALAIKNLKSLSMICDEVLLNARNFEDTLYTAFIAMSALTHSMIADSVEHGISICHQLGVDIPVSFSRQDGLGAIIQTQSMLNDIPDDILFNYRVMTDYRKVMAMKFLAKLEHSIQQVKPTLQPLVTTEMVKLTIEHGLSPVSAIGFAYFGGMVAELGDIRGGYRFTRLAKALGDRIQNSEIAGELIWLSTESLSFIEPLQTVNEYRIHGQATSMAAGDIHWACWNKASYCAALLWCGTNLSVVEEEITRNIRFIEGHDHLTTLNYLRIVKRTVMAISSEANEVINDDELMRHVIENKNPYQLAVLYFQKMLLSLVFNNYNDMKISAEKFLMFQVESWVLLSIHAGHFFIVSLASFRIYRETCNPSWMKKGKQYKERIIAWKDQGSSWNFESRSFLLQAEEFYCSGNFESAEAAYDKAISSALQHKFVHEAALIFELAANFYLDQGKKTMALKHFESALQRFQEWGAYAKVRRLQVFIDGNFVSEDHSVVESKLFSNSNDTCRFNSDARKRGLSKH